MKILIVSDSHSNNEVLDELIRKYKDCDLFLHAGDSETSPHSLYPFRVVKGNCDYFYDMKEEFIIPTPFGKILLRHKEDALSRYLKEKDIKIFVYGHSHKKECKKKNDIAYINPGAITYPRDGSSSYAILENQDKECYCTFYDLYTHEELSKYRIYIRNPNDPQIQEEEITEITKEENGYSAQEVAEAVNTIQEELNKGE